MTALPVLRFGLINVRGLLTGNGARIIQLAADAVKYKLDVLLVTESHLHTAAAEVRATDLLSAAATDMQAPGWRCFWGQATSSNSCGVAILVRANLISGGAVHVTVMQPTAVAPGSAARALGCRLTWGGHSLHLLTAYLPNDQSSRRTFFEGTLKAHHQAAAASHLQCLWGGDWNFLECVARDKHYAAGAVPPPGPSPCAASMAQHCPGLLDIYRQRYPACRQWTYFQPLANGTLRASRLDRYYVAPALAPYVLRCGTAGRYQLADHRLVIMDLQARQATSHGPGLPRVRVHYTRHRDLHARVDVWLRRQVPPTAGDAYAWWQGTKQRWAQHMRAMTAVAARRSREALAGRQALQAAKQRAAADLEAGRPGAAAAYADAERTLRRDRGRAAGGVERTRRVAWLHSREGPCPLVTSLIKPPVAATVIPSLRHPAGGPLLAGPAELPAAMVEHWASICSPKPVDQAARAEVLAAMRAHCTPIPPASATMLGSPDVTAAEVAAALRRLPPGTAPGPDGIPVDAYRKHAPALAPILARVYSSIGAAAARGEAAPRDFLLGAISFFYKKGPPSDPSNYRPITLLNADYRVLTRALATRLGPVLATVISPEQSAFLPGRRMGETVWLLQLLPHLLRSQGREAVLAFLDFAKAYDTVDRDFLLEAMGAMAAGPGFIAWVRALLSDTYAVAVVNGHASLPALFKAGVRQGDPLSPPLYLFVGEALLAWLKHKGYGLRLPGPYGEVRITMGQYADDVTPVLESLAQLPAFDRDMTKFGGATGQYLGKSKCQAMRIGQVAAGPAPSADSLPYPLVQEACTLGVLFSNSPITPDRLTSFWQERMDQVEARYDKISRLPLSAFGRGLSASGYGCSKLLFHMEFMGLPPAALLERLLAKTAALVDRRKPPTATGSSLTGVSLASLPGHPTAGGFGLLPLVRHVRARWAWWGLSFVCAAVVPGRPVPPWVAAARALLSSFAPFATPLVLLHHACGARPCIRPPAYGLYDCRVVLADVLADCEPLLRLVTALDGIPPARLAPGAAPVPAAVARDLPVCGNPYLRDAGGHAVELRYAYAFNAAWPLVTVEDVRAAVASLRSRPDTSMTRLIAADTLGLYAAIPNAWVAQCGMPRTAAEGLAAGRAAEFELLRRLVLPASAGAADPRLSVPLTTVPPVRVLMALTKDDALADRRPRVEAFLQEAGGPLSFGPVQFARRQAVLWRVPWENAHKEAFWRLPLDGIAFYGAARFVSAAAGGPLPCWCGTAGGTVCRTHLFWECPVARVVTRAIAAALSPHHTPSAAAAVRRFRLWLAEPPPGIYPGVWHVTALAALEAMWHGHRCLTAKCMAEVDRDRRLASDRSLLIAGVRSEHVRAACVKAASMFWGLLADFASLHHSSLPRGWPAERLQPGAPFLAVAAGGGGHGGLVAVSPPQAATVEAVVGAVLGPPMPRPAPP